MFVEVKVYEIRLKPFLPSTSDFITLVRPSASAVCQYDSWNDSTIASDKTLFGIEYLRAQITIAASYENSPLNSALNWLYRTEL
jgi:hypothetical protein